MFNLLDRYIARQVIGASLMMLLLLAALRSLFSLIDELGDLGRGGYQLSDALLFVALMFPSRIMEFFPMSVLIGTLFGLGAMAANSELTVMRAAGVTTWRIAGSAIKSSLVLMLLVVLIGELVTPISSKAAQQLRTAAISGGELSVSKTGLWARYQNQVIQLGNILTDGRLTEINIYELSETRALKKIIKADTAQKQSQYWLLQNVTEIEFSDNEITTSNSESRMWINPLDQDQIDSLILEPDTLNLSGLLSYIDYLKQNSMQAEVYVLAAWRKVMQPLAIAVMMFVGVSFIFGPMRNVSMGARILSGVMLGFVFHLANQSFGPVSLVFNIWPFVGAVTPLLLFAGLGYLLMKRAG
ncbi:LPS export ABC transporter permease LptG [Aliikangiella marina]|uniref:LPS export ABC transporter permease LptG n=1 Tax=Aliikangiella marina TaxID=1712262 RepID=A0A545THY4_9GAMM|nr:LPS export ABC transporter permease LptG [Aliikangiella marina]TQV76771.1 LPS export ABC transporter permease LptG [Aliikangiella marina]